MSFDLLDGIKTNGQKSPRPSIDQKHTHHTGKEINLLVLGMHGTGKTVNIIKVTSVSLHHWRHFFGVHKSVYRDDFGNTWFRAFH